jgi:predicted ATPase
MGKDTTEILEIHNFLSISNMKWEIEKFNIITGDMAAGKSLCIKLVKFFEDIIPNLLIEPYEIFIKNLDPDQFFNSLVHSFTNIFSFSVTIHKKRPKFKIKYTFFYKEETFNIVISGKDENDITIDSSFLKGLLQEWKKFIEMNIRSGVLTSDGFREAKLSMHNELSKKFGGYFPIATTFIPASRAALAVSSSYSDFYLRKYESMVDLLPQFNSRNQKMIETILKAKIKINGTLFLESNDGRQVPLLQASSGQQEIVYVLMLLDRLGNYNYTYGKCHSVFIEEPSAHLFPLEQKQAIELIVEIFNILKENGNPVSFFITTHSPYVLNSLNNILTKGALLDKYEDQKDRINETVGIPHLKADEISAYFINNNGTADNMLDMDEKYIFADKIAEISYDIDKATAELSQLKNELHGEKE